MNFLNLNEIRELLGSLKRVTDGLQADQFEALKVNNFKIHFATGAFSHSMPKIKLNSILDYDSVAINITDYSEKSDTTSLVKPKKDPRFSYFDWTNYFSYPGAPNVIHASYIGCNIPIQISCQIIKDIYKVSQLKTFF